MKPLGKKTAGILYSHEYQIIDKQARVLDVAGISNISIYLYDDVGTKVVSFIEIGTEYWILARPLKDLTSIGNENTPINHHTINMLIDENNSYGDITLEYFDNDSLAFNIESGGFSGIYLNFKTIDIVREELLKNHFAINLEPEWWKPIKD